ncbi:MAG TPA: AraC family transcriptional regulator [Bradyrhizobium sp.]|nr:AraC family transcriptional regulator [Bradyrhizobium sp.]
MEIRRRSLFESSALQIGLFEARPSTDACGEVERQSLNAIVLPVGGLFAKHEALGRHVTGTPSHAIYFAPDLPYKISFPGCIGDRAITLRFGEALAPEHVDAGDGLPSQGLLPAQAMMLRNLLWTRLDKGEADAFEAESLGLDLLNLSLQSVRSGKLPVRRSAQARRRRAVELVKEAVASAPCDKWNVAKLARVANLSPFHFCHVFREMVGTSIYDYVLHERLARTLDAVLDGGDDLTAIALDAGFSSHSHFTARFKNFFGCTPAALRRIATSAHIAELRKIVTARPSRAV